MFNVLLYGVKQDPRPGWHQRGGMFQKVEIRFCKVEVIRKGRVILGGVESIVDGVRRKKMFEKRQPAFERSQ